MWQKKYLMKGIKLMKFKLTNLGNPSENIILYSNSNELAKILSIYGSLIEEVEKDGKVLTPEQLLAIQNDFEWDYLSPQEAYDLIDMVKLPTDIQYKLSNNGTYLPKELAHKENQENVLLSEYETFGKSIAFRAYSDWKELDSDHMSDHVDGIKLFEIIRQGMLAAFHINNLKYDSSLDLTNLKIEYFQYIETFIPFIVHIIPINRADGGAMYTVFGVYQEDKLVAKGYLGAYAFRTKEAYRNKRKLLKEGAYNIAEQENWPIIESKKEII